MCRFLPWYSSCLHLVGHRHVSRPHVILPALLSEHAAQNRPRMHPDTHVHVRLRLLSNISEIQMNVSDLIILKHAQLELFKNHCHEAVTNSHEHSWTVQHASLTKWPQPWPNPSWWSRPRGHRGNLEGHKYSNSSRPESWSSTGGISESRAS